MNKKQRKILKAIFATPILKTLPWNDIESLFKAIGCEVIEGDGSRVGFRLRGARVAFHRPHPRKEAQEYQIRAAKEFLETLGIRPEL
jgi:hypothetical protein